MPKVGPYLCGGGGDGAAMRQNAKTGSLNECIEMARVSHRMSEFQDPSKELGHEFVSSIERQRVSVSASQLI